MERKKMIKKTIKQMFLIASFLASFVYLVSFAADPKTRETYGIYMTQYKSFLGTANVGGSSITVPGQLMAYTVYAKGSDITFEIKHSTGTGWQVHASSPITVPSGAILSDDVRMVVKYPTILISTMPTIGNATAYFTFTYIKNE